MNINGYEIIGELRTDNSGTAKWGFCTRNGVTLFIKEFLTPTYPEDASMYTPAAAEIGRNICATFERNKGRLYGNLSQCKGGGVVYATDFFRYKSKYYMVTPKIDMSTITIENIAALDLKTKVMLCRVIAFNMISLHERGIIHADIKPDNIIIKQTITGTHTAKIIDFDSSFFEDALPEPDDFQCDTVYMAPESFLYICEENDKLSTKIDIFALGILFCQYFTGELPMFDKDEYTYLYASILDGARFGILNTIPAHLQDLLMRMLSKNPEDRPDIKQVLDGLSLEKRETRSGLVMNMASPSPAPAPAPSSAPMKKKGFKQAHTTL